MKNIIDIYESILSRTKDKVLGAKDIVDKVSLKALDNHKYAKIFNASVLEDIIFILNIWTVTDKEYTFKVLNDLDEYNIPIDDNVIDFFYRLSQINNEHKIVEQWTYYYGDKKSVEAGAGVVGVDVLKPVFKHGKIYKNYSAKQKEMRNWATHFWKNIDNSEQYVAFYRDSDHDMFWLWIPKSLNADDKVFMENVMNLMVKYNK
jgi:hypothetical protein